MPATPTHTDDGVPIVHISPKPFGTNSMFFGAGDHPTNGIGQGQCFALKMTASDVSKSIDITFNEAIYMKDGMIYRENAPFGSCLDVEVYAPNPVPPPNDFKVGIVVARLQLWGTGPLPFTSDDSMEIPLGIIFRVTVYNATGTGDHDPATDFKVTGYGDAFRTTIT